MSEQQKDTETGQHLTGRILFFSVVALAVGVVGFAFYLDGRLGDIEDRLSYAVPRSYEPPNLEDFAVGNVVWEDLQVHKLIYVPIYSHVYYQGGVPYSLEATLSIRNIDQDQAVYVKSIDYYDTSGALVRKLIDRPIKLEPLSTIEFLVEGRDAAGGSGANFLVDWSAEPGVDNPLVEAIMVGTAGTQGISFGRIGVEITRSQTGSDERNSNDR